MRIEVFKIDDKNWGVRFPGKDGLEIAGFETVQAAHVWLLQFALQGMKQITEQKQTTETERQMMGAALLGVESEKKKQ